MSENEKAKTQIHPRLRIIVGKSIAFGPGKAELLEAIQQTGSITRSAAQMGMSYMRAWTLIRTMNRCFRQPLVITQRGGTKGGGGARLTETGCEVLTLYRRMQANCLEIVKPDYQRLQKLLRD